MQANMLSRGVIAALNNAQTKEDEPQNPILQVLEVKTVNAGAGPARYKLTLTDGITTVPAMISQQITHLVTESIIKVNCLVKVKQYLFQSMQSTRIMICVDVEVVGYTDQAFFHIPTDTHAAVVGYPPQQQHAPPQQQAYGGSHTNVPTYGNTSAPPTYGQQPSHQLQQQVPQTYGAPGQVQGIPTYGSHPQVPTYGNNNPPPTNTYGAPQQVHQQPHQQQQQPTYGAPYGGNTGGVNYGSGSSASGSNRPVVSNYDNNVQITPIRDINPYSNKWTIKARVTKKSDIKSWSKPNSQGTLFSIDLLDTDSTEIRATFFKEACDKFFPIIAEQKVYTFSGGKLKVVANSSYSQIKNPYELTFDTNSDIRPAVEDGGIKSAGTCHFIKIANISTMEPNALVDVIGIVKHAGDLQEIISQKMGGKVLLKRDLTIYDDSKAEIRLTLWGDKAREDIQWIDQIIALKGVKIGDYQGRTLGSTQSSTIMLNPHPSEMPQAYQLSQWRATDMNASQSLTSLSGSGNGAVETLEKRKPISAIREEGVGLNEKGDYFSFKATVNYIKHDNDPWYTACPSDGCNKKVVDIGNGYWRCEKCNKEYQNCAYRYVMSLTVADTTGQQWVSLFNDVAEKLIGVSAQEIHILKMEGYEDRANKIYNDALFKSYCMKARAKMESVNDEARLKVTLLSATPIDYRSEGRQLIDAIRKYV